MQGDNLLVELHLNGLEKNSRLLHFQNACQLIYDMRGRYKLILNVSLRNLIGDI